MKVHFKESYERIEARRRRIAFRSSIRLRVRKFYFAHEATCQRAGFIACGIVGVLLICWAISGRIG
jgi:hypothetical protein